MPRGNRNKEPGRPLHSGAPARLKPLIPGGRQMEKRLGKDGSGGQTEATRTRPRPAVGWEGAPAFLSGLPSDAHVRGREPSRRTAREPGTGRGRRRRARTWEDTGGCGGSRLVRQLPARLRLQPVLPLHHGTSQAAGTGQQAQPASVGRGRRCARPQSNRRSVNATALFLGTGRDVRSLLPLSSAGLSCPEPHG